MSKYLEARLAEFEKRASGKIGLNFEKVAPHLPQDPKARLAALATVMGLDAALSLREDISIEDLEQHAENYRTTAEQMLEDGEDNE